MDNNHHNHVFDPALQSIVEQKQQQLAQHLSSREHNHNHNHELEHDAQAAVANGNPGLSSDGGAGAGGAPVKRRPGRPKGSTKKNLLASGSPVPPKIKRPVGRPRKDGFPAGSVGPRVKKERPPGAQQGVPMVQYGAPLPGVGYPPMAFGYSISAPLPPPGVGGAPPPPMGQPVFHIDPSLAVPDGDDWAELARTNPNGFLSTLLAALAAPNPVSSAGPTVEEAFKSHLVSLAPNPQQMQPIPSLYSILKTFWLPSSPAYFSLTASASTARTPSEHRFLYWDPQPLVFNGIACPSCSAPLINKGRISSGPVKIYDIERPFFIIGCEYTCRSPMCIAATSAEGRKFASTDSSILRSLPLLLKDEFPAKLLNGEADAGSGPNVWNWKAMGVSTGLWNLVMAGLRCGLRKDVILRLVWAVQHKMPEMPLENGVGQPSGAQQQGESSQQHDHEKMEEEEDEEGDNDADEDHTMASTGSNQPQPPPQPQTQSQTLSSNAFSDAFSNAWKENTATSPQSLPQPHSQPQPQPQSHPPVQVQSPPKKTPTPAQGQVQRGAGVTSPAPPPPPPHVSTPPVPPRPIVSSPQHQHQHSHIQPVPVPQPQPQPQLQQMMPPTTGMAAPSYNPYTAYPFTSYAYMPHSLVNGQYVPVPMPASSSSASASSTGMPSAPPPSISTTGVSTPAPLGPSTSASASTSAPTPLPTISAPIPIPVPHPPPPPPPPAGGTPISGPKRSPRHCCKCGSQDCKGKGGRAFCTNGCQDCGKLECKGRNSRRPDKRCSEGWS